ncbi:hypothetical protein [uncultured Erythrobacter sp.]|uniref:hypothetical protein n=1 Tax=uncultured Erythrobacter sp. TaxID=263913 RepID=UPI00261CB858|nr:hypothetical protein [uncultured Erythrobacter sp.]
MNHFVMREYRDPQTGISITRVFAFEAETQEEYQATLEEINRMPPPDVPDGLGGEDIQ